ncbi:hypothetical protein [Asanoa sp. NPDC050611]|uniref:hypothetical protein n=1 Tax=Asanoa sp. NPDC050611 TaxID=3157098 RepID=UPI0033CAEB33
MRWLRIAPVVVLLAAGCSGGAPRDVDPGPALAAQRTTATNILARWDRAAAGDDVVVVQPLGGLRQVGDWEAAVGDNHKAALLAGLVEAAGRLPAAHDQGTIRLADGRTRPVRPLTAAAALDRAARSRQPCAPCRPLRVTGARPITADLDTVGGRVMAPAWEFTLADSAVRLVGSAVPDGAVTVLPAFGRPEGHDAAPWLEHARAADGPALAVSFAGAIVPADEPCGSDYVGEAVESARAVVVLIAVNRTYDGKRCPMIGGVRSLTVRLRAPLGERTVLQLYTGLPITG